MDIASKNNRGDILSGVIDQADNPIAQAVFSHCFTCSKDHAASYRICKALADKNIQVLRFDFTGLDWARVKVISQQLIFLATSMILKRPYRIYLREI